MCRSTNSRIGDVNLEARTPTKAYTEAVPTAGARWP